MSLQSEILERNQILNIIIRINIHARNRAPRFFFNGINLTVVENDIAILQIKNKEKFKCVEKLIWPACLPSKVSRYFETKLF